MSQRRSGLLSGLIVGFIASLVCASGVAAAVYVEDRLPALLKAWNGWPLATGIALLAGVIIGLAMGAARPRSLLLPPLAALYAGAAEAVGLLVGIAPHSIPVILPLPLDASAPAAPALRLPRVDEIMDGLRPALDSFLGPIRVSWPVWLVVALAAMAAFLVVSLRVRRVRRRDQDPDETQDPEEPEYRAPFEPAQAPTQQPTADLFTPRKPTQNQ